MSHRLGEYPVAAVSSEENRLTWAPRFHGRNVIIYE